MLTRIIPATGEPLPAIGLGTWQTFDAGSQAYPQLEAVLDTLHRYGGRLIDSSPMYGRAEQAIGAITAGMPAIDDFFYATKVWTTGHAAGIRQIEASLHKMQRRTMDLLQIHNLVDWKTQLATLLDWKESGRIRYIGITHYTDASHEELERVLRTGKFDFVQCNYSITDRHAAARLLPAAAALGVAVIINRPFGEGALFTAVKHQPLPAWATEAGISSWGSFFLKYILAHPAVTCVIPATADPAHAAANYEAGNGYLPDDAMRQRMEACLAQL